MNAPDFKYWGLMALILLCCAGILAVRQPAGDPARSSVTPWFEGIAAPEVPTVAVRQLQGVSPGRRMALVNQMLQELAKAQPGVVPFFLAAVSRQFPDLAPSLLVEAIALQPGQTVASVRAVSTAVPERMEGLITECVRSLPDAFPLVAIVAAEQHPESAEAIVKAVAAALPEAGPALETAVKRQGQFPINVRQVLFEADRLVQSHPVHAANGKTGYLGTQSPAALPSNDNEESNNRPPFSCLQQLAKARAEKVNQLRTLETCTNGASRPGVGLPSFSYSGPTVSLGDSAKGLPQEAENQVEVR